MNRGDHGQRFRKTEREGGGARVDQKADKTTSINVEPSEQTESQLKQQQMDNFHLCSGQSHLLLPHRRSWKLQPRGDRTRAGGCGKEGSARDRWMWQRLISATARRDLRNAGLEDEAPDSRHVLSRRRDALGEHRGQDGKCISRSAYTPGGSTKTHVTMHRGELHRADSHHSKGTKTRRHFKKQTWDLKL